MLGGNIQCRYDPQDLGSKIGQNNPKTRRKLLVGEVQISFSFMESFGIIWPLQSIMCEFMTTCCVCAHHPHLENMLSEILVTLDSRIQECSAALRREINSMNDDMAARDKNVNQRISRLENNLKNMEGRFEEIDPMTKEFRKLGKELAKVNTKVDKLEAHIATEEKRRNTEYMQLRQAACKIESLHAHMENICQLLDRETSGIAQLTERVAACEDDMTDCKQRCECILVDRSGESADLDESEASPPTEPVSESPVLQKKKASEKVQSGWR